MPSLGGRNSLIVASVCGKKQSELYSTQKRTNQCCFATSYFLTQWTSVLLHLKKKQVYELQKRNSEDI